jgi:PAS domain S-box-containing protein
MNNSAQLDQTIEKKPPADLLEQITPAFTQQEPAGQFVIDAEGIIHSANEALGLLFGYSTKELIGENINILTPKKCNSSRAKLIKTYLESNTSKHPIYLTTSGHKKDGTKLPFQLGVSTLEMNNCQLIIGNLLNLTKHQEKDAMSKLIAKEILSKTGGERIHAATNHLRAIMNSPNVYFSVYNNIQKQETKILSLNGKKTDEKMIHDIPYTSIPNESYTYYPNNFPHNSNETIIPPSTQSYLSTHIKDKDNNHIGFLTVTNEKPTKFSAFQIDNFSSIAALLGLDYQQLICNKKQKEALTILENKNKILNYWHTISEIEKNTKNINSFLEEITKNMPEAFVHSDKVHVNIDLFKKQHNPQYDNSEKTIHTQDINIRDKKQGVISISQDINTIKTQITLTDSETDLIEDTIKRINNYVQLYRAKQAYHEETDMLNRSGLLVFKSSSAAYSDMQFTSPHIAHLFEYTPEEFQVRNLQYSDLIHPEDKDTILKILEKNIQNTKMCHFENPPYRIITKNNKVKWVNHPVCIIRDINTKKAVYLKGLICDNSYEAELKEDINKLNDAFTKLSETVRRSLNMIINYSMSLASTLITNTELAQNEIEQKERDLNEIETMKLEQKDLDLKEIATTVTITAAATTINEKEIEKPQTNEEKKEKQNLSAAWNYNRIDEIIKTIYQLKETVTHKMTQPLKDHINSKKKPSKETKNSILESIEYAHDNIVIIVDDTKVAQCVLGQYCNIIKVNSIPISNGQDAVNSLKALASAGKAPDLILMDIEMPIMSGVQAMARIRADEALNNGSIPIVAISGDSKYKAGALTAGCTEFILKPFMIEDFHEIFKKYLRKKGEEINKQ